MRVTSDSDLIRVLLIEDNSGDALLIKEAFQESGSGCIITSASDGEAALEMLRGIGAEQPDLILLDLNLPKLNGHEVLKQLKADSRLRSIPVMILTSSCAYRDVSAAYDLHCNAYFCKPATFAEYVDLTHALTNFWQQAVGCHPATNQN
jgi:CheY-like chemotaxis protein